MSPTPENSPPAPSNDPHADPDWFREPSRREHWIAAWLFLGFGVFFILLFFVLSGWWFRWVVLVLGVYSIVHALGHVRDTRLADR